MKRNWIAILPLVLLTACGAGKTVTPLATSSIMLPPPIANNGTQSATAPLKITGLYLMAFHACDSFSIDCSNPQNHQVYLAQSDDGLDWSLIPDWVAIPGSVPDVVRRADTIYLYARGGLTRIHLDSGLMDASVPIDVSGVMVTDPSFFVDERGRLVVFFLHGQMGSDPASCAPGEDTCTKRFGSATEVEGSDGARFNVNSGDRATVPLNSTGQLRSASDPDISYDNSNYYLYISHGQSISVWISPELHGTYMMINIPPLGYLSMNTGGVASAYYNAEKAEFWTYAHVHQQVGTVIRRAVHKDFSTQLEENNWTTVLTGESIGLGVGINVESPSFIVNQP